MRAATRTLLCKHNRAPQVMNNSHTGTSVVMYQCGTPRPNVSYATDYISVPVDTVAVTSTTYIPWVELLGMRTSLVACVAAACVAAARSPFVSA